jgi:oligopeptidase A
MTHFDAQFLLFDKLNHSQLDKFLEANLADAITALDKVEVNTKTSWNSLQDSLYLKLYNLSQIWVIANHLQSVNDSPELRKLQEKYQNKISEFYVRLGQSKKLYNLLKHIKANESRHLNEEAIKIIDNEFRDFKLSGIELDTHKQTEFKNIQNKLTGLSTKFEQNVLDATDNYSKTVDLKDLKGVPEDLLAQYKIDDNKYRITLHIPSYLPIMEYCENRALREELYHQYVTRASEFNGGHFDNSQNICEILNLRRQKAQLLGFNDYTELSLFTKMATNASEVLDFLYNLAEKSKEHAKKELEELKTFAKTNCGIDALEPWDIPFVSEKLQQYKYSYSNWELKQYFQLEKVLDGLFKLIFELYQVEFKIRSDIPSWHPDTKVYELSRDNNSIGLIYLDLFARNGKQSGAWMNSMQDRFVSSNVTKEPQATIICNFTPPNTDDTTLLTFDEVQTLFHEIGHSLHHLLTTINHFNISGINGVEWDAVELPSQFMEYFAWDRKILNNISSHTKTGLSIPDELYQKLVNARYYQSGLAMLRQIEFSVLDIKLHQANISSTQEYLDLTNEIRGQIAVIPQVGYNRFLNSFGHIFAGGYASGYYSYKWAEVLATDIFSVFENQPCYTTLGNKFYNTILSQGGLKPMLDNFIAFMGREPQIDALLKNSGIN